MKPKRRPQLRESLERPAHLPPEGTPIKPGSHVSFGKYFVFDGEPMSPSPARSGDPEVLFKQILERTRILVKPLGFKKRGQAFVRSRGVSAQIIQFQRSQWRSAGDPIEFTVNVRVWIPELAPQRDPAHPPIGDTHISERIGYFTSSQADTWWTLGETGDVEEVWEQIVIPMQGVLRFCDEATSLEGLGVIAPRCQADIFTVEIRRWLQKKGVLN